MSAVHFDRIDLHMHTTVSDGTDTPEEIIAKAKEAGLDLFSVTDHDASAGCIRIIGKLTHQDPAFITGAEFSCRDDQGKYHILGYGFDPEANSMRSLVEEEHDRRMLKLKIRLDHLEEIFGIRFSEDDMDALYMLDNPGKPHLGNLLVKYGYADKMSEAISKYVDGAKCRNMHVRTEVAIKCIRESGGIPVLAHPSYGSGGEFITGAEMDRRISRLKDMGLEGVEAYYSTFTEDLIHEMTILADKYKLLVTAGSDYHGANKDIKLGYNKLKSVPEGHHGVRDFIDAVSDRIIKA
ncbi:MAG: PHP domain-containing protein [Clostridiales bacterium]|nr:PHP domain-containing protein [Clostridiales bacterium]